MEGAKLTLSDFDYDLPPELIAQYPAEQRGQSRLMVVDRTTGDIQIGMFEDIVRYAEPGDALVLNDTKVFPARLRAEKASTSAQVELLMYREVKKGVWEALARPGKRLKVGTLLSIKGARKADTVEVIASDGAVKTLRFHVDDVRQLCWRVGEIPLPFYIKRDPEAADAERYQTVFAKSEGAVAAPTAGLHFTSRILKRLTDKGVSLEYVTLHISLGTFQPLEHEEVQENKLHPEHYRMTPRTARRLNEARREGHKVFAVGTTTLRLLETIIDETGKYTSGEGVSEIFIFPGHDIRSADILLTNFHLPRSSLLLLVCAFAGRDLILRAYEQAVKKRFRCYSYGDAMLII